MGQQIWKDFATTEKGIRAVSCAGYISHTEPLIKL